jgi:hypothetical protein
MRKYKGDTIRKTNLKLIPTLNIKALTAGCPAGMAMGFLLVLVQSARAATAETLVIPNGSFESPKTAFVDPRVDSWQKTPKPIWYTEAGGYTWDQLTGGFQNTPAGSVDHIDNADGDQALFLFAVPTVGLFQDYNSTDWTNTTPTHAFNARFEVGKSYRLQLGVIGGGGGMLDGTSLMLSLYYRDAASNQVTVAATNIVFDRTRFTNTTHLIDCETATPVVAITDPWANQNIGVQVISTVDPTLAGGYWDLDNFRLTATASAQPEGPALRVLLDATDLVVSWMSTAGYQYQAVTSNDLLAWTDFEAAMPGTGAELTKRISTTSSTATFVRVKSWPTP